MYVLIYGQNSNKKPRFTGTQGLGGRGGLREEVGEEGVRAAEGEEKRGVRREREE